MATRKISSFEFDQAVRRCIDTYCDGDNPLDFEKIEKFLVDIFEVDASLPEIARTLLKMSDMGDLVEEVKGSTICFRVADPSKSLVIKR